MHKNLENLHRHNANARQLIRFELASATHAADKEEKIKKISNAKGDKITPVL